MKQTKTYLFFLFLFLPLIVFTQNTTKDTTKTHTKLTVQKDTIYIVKQISDDATAKHYQEILEKTNGQLSLWWNPYGVFVGFLGILFTILTIIAAVVIYRQSKEYRELIKESLTKHETVLGQLITEKNQQLKNIETHLNNLITEYKEKLINTREENKKEINDLISKLEIQKESIDTQIHAKYVTPEYNDQFLTSASLYGMQNKPHMCSKCGYGYFVKDDPLGSATRVTVGYGSKTITCPKCGNVEIYYSLF